MCRTYYRRSKATLGSRDPSYGLNGLLMVPMAGRICISVVEFFLLCAPLMAACLLVGCEPTSTASISNLPTEAASTTGDSDRASGVAEPTPPNPKADAPDGRAGNLFTGEIVEISFDDIVLGIPEDVRFRPFMLTDEARELDGRRVRIGGYMHGGVDQIRGIQEFILLRNKECKFGPGGKADHLVQVFLQGGATTSYTSEVVVVEGILTVNPFHGADGFTWSIYKLAGTSAKERR